MSIRALLIAVALATVAQSQTPRTVYTSLDLLRVQNVQESSFDATFVVRMFWVDATIAAPTSTTNGNVVDPGTLDRPITMPTIENAVSVTTVGSPTYQTFNAPPPALALLTFTPAPPAGNYVQLTMKVIATIEADNDFKKFPFDSHDVVISVSLAPNTVDKWIQEVDTNEKFGDNVESKGFFLGDNRTSWVDNSEVNSGSQYSVASWQVTVNRRSNLFLSYFSGPIILLMLIGLFLFALPRGNTQRVTNAVILFIGLLLLHQVLFTQLNVTSATRAHWYARFSLGLLFASIIAHIIINALEHCEPKDHPHDESLPKGETQHTHSKWSRIAFLINVICAVAYFIAFFIASIVIHYD